MRPIGIAAATAIALFAAAITPAIAEPPNDQAALSGLNEVKVAFDVTTGDGNALLKQLEVINETRQALIKQGVKPHFVIAFRGPATKLVQKDQKQIKADDREYAAKIAEKVNALRSADGITSIEQCAVAVRLASTKPEDVIPGVKLVGNGWISLMAYQAKGYGYIAPQHPTACLSDVGSAAQEPMVRGLTAGAKGIRTAGPRKNGWPVLTALTDLKALLFRENQPPDATFAIVST